MKKATDPTTAFVRDFARRCAIHSDNIKALNENYTAFVRWWLLWWLEHGVLDEPRRVTFEEVQTLFSGAKPSRKTWATAHEQIEALRVVSERAAEQSREQSVSISEILTLEADSGLLAIAAAALYGEGEVFNALRAFHRHLGTDTAGPAAERALNAFSEAIANLMNALVSARIAHDDLRLRGRQKFTREKVLVIMLGSFLDGAWNS